MVPEPRILPKFIDLAIAGGKPQIPAWVDQISSSYQRNGLPVLDSALRWPGCNLHIMGGAAALQLGPVARNLAGARMAGDRLAQR